MKRIVMTKAQTLTYRRGDEHSRALMLDLVKEARVFGDAGEVVEIYTFEGALVDTVQGEAKS